MGSPAPPLDPLARDYVALAFAIERHVPGFVDAYFGPPELREVALAGPVPEPMRLVEQTRSLAMRLAEADIPDSRVAYLTAQVGAMLATCRRLAGDTISYRDEVHLLFDVEPEQTPEASFEAAIAELDDVLPGRGPVGERMVAWRDEFVVSPDVARGLIDVIVPEIQRRTQALLRQARDELPAGEAVEFRFVRDQPWRGYNWYLGNGRSRVELNTDLPIHANRLVDLLTHEAYPGHHTEHALKEFILYRGRGYGEHAIQLTNTPECVISEGVATLSAELIFADNELIQFQLERLYPAVGLKGEPEREAAIARARRTLRAVPGNAALLLHAAGRDDVEVVAYLMRHGALSEREARQQLRFIADPLWRAYVFTYHAGYDLLGAWLTAGPPVERIPRFHTLLTEQVYPSLIARRLAEERDGTPDD